MAYAIHSMQMVVLSLFVNVNRIEKKQPVALL